MLFSKLRVVFKNRLPFDFYLKHVFVFIIFDFWNNFVFYFEDTDGIDVNTFKLNFQPKFTHFYHFTSSFQYFFPFNSNLCHSFR